VGKYRSKFEDAVRSGPLNGQPTGILLGIPKIEKDIIPSLFSDLDEGRIIEAPSKLFGKENPGLVLVWVFTLTRTTCGAHLLPSLVLPWSHPDLASDLKAFQPDQLRIQWEPCPYDFSNYVPPTT